MRPSRARRGALTAVQPAAALVLVVVMAVLGAGTLGPVAGAAGRPDDRLDRLVRFLQETQNDDGGYGGAPGAESDPMMSAWVGIGLAAAGINPQDQRAPGRHGRSVAQYVAARGPARSDGRAPVTTEYERIAMFANAAGLDPRRFGGRDYITPLLARQARTAWSPPAGSEPVDPFAGASGPVGAGGLPTDGASSGSGRVKARPVPAGWFPHARGGRTPGVNDTVFAVFALAGSPGRGLRGAIRRAARAIEAMQRPDGTWPAVQPGDGTNVDMTGAAIQALCVADRCRTPVVRRALRWLRVHQQRDGGWQAGDMRDERAGQSNSGTTPWVVQALWATGNDPARWRAGGSGFGRAAGGGSGRDPLAFLRTLQRRDGSIRWRADRDLNPTWMTAYAAPAFAGHPWPVPSPPRAAAVRRERAAAARARQQRRARRDERRAGDAGDADGGSGTVSAGGGGRGADLFTRPQPQSRGRTAGGVRDTRRDQSRRAGTRGRDGATGTAAASGPGDGGGVQNGDRRRNGDSGGPAVSGTVVQAPRGTEGTERERAVAPGLRSAAAGGTAPPWATITLGGLALLAVVVGAGLERRPDRSVRP